LTRRANHLHIVTIAESKARAGKPAAGFFSSHFLNRTAAARHGASSSHAMLPEASQAGRRPNLILSFAGTRERAGTRAWLKSTAARGLHGMEIRFAPEMIAKAIMPHIYFLPRRCRHDRIADRARPGRSHRHRSVGGVRVTAKIIRFAPRQQPKTNGVSKLAFRSNGKARPCRSQAC
jgi:hypothetical protein